MTPNLFRCEAFNGEFPVSQCLVNQARGRLEGDLSRYWKCTTCNLGQLYREANGGKLPEVRQGKYGLPEVVRPRREDMAKVAVKINGEAVTLPGGQPLTASTPAAAARIAEAVAPSPQPFRPAKVERPCKNHPDRESLLGQSMCRECKQAYQREWHRKRKEEKMAKQTQKAPVVPIAPVKEKTAALCCVCQEQPRHGKSNRCLACLQAQVNTPEARASRVKSCSDRAREAHAIRRRFVEGELVLAEERYQPIFALVAGIEERIRERAEKNLRTIEAEMAVILRDALCR